MARLVSLPSDVPGRLYLHAMPGRYESWASTREIFSRKGVDLVVALTPLEEILLKSPDYAQAIEARKLPWDHELFPIPDFGVPDDRAAFLALARSVAMRLREGRCIIIHCGAGIGRTGTLAVCVLMALGEGKEEACEAVKHAGSGCERPDQNELVGWVASQLFPESPAVDRQTAEKR
jgi:protein-tyrosine phosphatase